MDLFYKTLKKLVYLNNSDTHFCYNDDTKGIRITALINLIICFTLCFGRNTFLGVHINLF